MAAILKNTADIKGAYVHGVLKEFLCSFALAVNPRYKKQKKLLFGLQQALSKIIPLIITVRIPPGLPKILGRTLIEYCPYGWEILATKP